MITIRTATSEDARAIADVQVHTWKTAYHGIIADEFLDGRDDFRGELYGLCVHPDWHGRGVGKRLVATFAEWLLDSGMDTMLVWTLADNPFRRFYGRLGGKLVAEKGIEIGEQKLVEVAYGWDDVWAIAAVEGT